MAINLDRTERSLQRIVDAVIELIQGRDNAHDVVTLRAGQTTTVVTHPNCSRDSRPTLTPTTANAAAALATTYISAVTQGSFTITHASNAQADRTFYYSVRGG